MSVETDFINNEYAMNKTYKVLRVVSIPEYSLITQVTLYVKVCDSPSPTDDICLKYRYNSNGLPDIYVWDNKIWRSSTESLVVDEPHFLLLSLITDI